jgi:ABC-2 type transport system permease protein
MTGPIVFGLSVMAVGWLGVGIGALTNQLSASSSIANSTGSIILVIFYIMRMMGDLGTNDTLTWISPLGWAQKMAPWGENRAWLMIPNIILVVVLIAIAFVIEARRDYGSGVLKDKAGHPDASPLKRRSWGLILHLYKGSIIGWSLGVIIFGLLFGSVVNTMMSMLKDINVPFLNTSSMDSMLGFMLCFIGLVSVVLPMFIMIGLRTDETKGLTEVQLAGSVSRYKMVLERYVIGIIATVLLLVLGGASFGLSFGAASNDMSQIGRLALDALIYLPGIMAITSVTALLFGLFPRATIPVTWFIYGLMYFAVLLIDQKKTPMGVIYLFPFLGTPKIPGAGFDPIVIVYLIVAIAFVAIGMLGLRKRNVPR